MAQERDSVLLLSLAKEAFHRQIAKRVRPLARSYVTRWMGCEFWLYPAVLSRHATELRAFRAVVLEVLRDSSADEMLAICRGARPDLSDLWSVPAAREKLEKELAEAIKAVEGL
jgi:hypothetical protein